MASYIVLDQQGSFPSAENPGQMVFGVTTSNQVSLKNSNGQSFFFGAGPVNYTTYDVDLLGGGYTITGTGIYRIFRGENSASNTLDFPDPANFVGGTIVVINNDTSSNESGFFGGAYVPYSLGNSSTVSSIPYNNIYVFYSINSEWRGGKLAGI